MYNWVEGVNWTSRVGVPARGDLHPSDWPDKRKGLAKEWHTQQNYFRKLKGQLVKIELERKILSIKYVWDIFFLFFPSSVRSNLLLPSTPLSGSLSVCSRIREKHISDHRLNHLYNFVKFNQIILRPVFTNSILINYLTARINNGLPQNSLRCSRT